MLPRGFHPPKRPYKPPTRQPPMRQGQGTGKRSLERAGLFTDRNQDEVKRPRTSTDLAYDNLMADLASKTQEPVPAAPANQAEEVDPLDAFMAGITQDLKRQNTSVKKKKRKEERLGLAEEQPEYMVAEKKSGGKDDDKDVYRIAKEIDKEGRNNTAKYDTNGNLITEKNRIVEKLQKVDYSKVFYRKVKKNIYVEHPEIFAMDTNQVHSIRVHTGTKVEGNDVPNPVCSFAHFSFDDRVIKNITRQGFTKPTGIQCQAVPCILSGRDMMGIAKTGSGKTAAFVWPMICQILSQDPVEPGEGPIAVICAPTRELAQQIYNETLKFIRGTEIRACPLYGGMTMFEQKQTLAEGVEIIVGTPGRIIDMIKKEYTNCFHVTYLILDEADRMFSLGFESQMRSIVGQCRPDRQTLLFSATMNKKVRVLANDVLTNPIHITVGGTGVANKDIRQIVEVVKNLGAKYRWLKDHMQSFLIHGRILIFCGTKMNCERLYREVQPLGLKSSVIHGDKGQLARQSIIHDFRTKKIEVLIATDVAARGLDIKGLKTVINFDTAHTIDAHIHRIGRTGRAGEQGMAYTVFDKSQKRDKRFAPLLVKCLRKSQQHVPDPLLVLAKMKKANNIGAPPGLSKLGVGGGRNLRGKKLKQAKVSWRKHGFDTRDASSVKNSFMSTFASASGVKPGLQPGQERVSEESMKRVIRKPKRSRWGQK